MFVPRKTMEKWKTRALKAEKEVGLPQSEDKIYYCPEHQSVDEAPFKDVVGKIVVHQICGPCCIRLRGEKIEKQAKRIEELEEENVWWRRVVRCGHWRSNKT